MIPILYKATEREFESNGLGRLSDAVECTVTEERNGQYELQMIYPITGIHYADLVEERIILAKPSDGTNDQPFEIYDISEPLDGVVTVRARHISYRLKELVVRPFRADSPARAMQMIGDSIVGEHPFSFWTNKITTGVIDQKVPISCRSILGGVDGSVLDSFGGGEYEFDRFTVRLWENRGTDRGVSVRYGKNLTDYNGERDISGVYTSVVPYWQGQDDAGAEIEVVGGKVESDHVGDYCCQKCMPLDLSAEFETPPTESQLEARARAYMESNAPWQRKVAVNISFLPLEKTLEYADVSVLEHVRLCDTITVEHHQPVKAKVIKTVFNVLQEVYISLDIGDARSTFAQTATRDTITERSVDRKVQSAVRKSSEWLNGLVQNASGLYSTAQVQPDGSTVYYLHDKKTMGQSRLVMKLTAEAIGLSADGGKTYPYGFTITGEMVMGIIRSEGINADWIDAGNIDLNKLSLKGTACGVMQGYGSLPNGTTTQGIVIYFNGLDEGGNAKPPYLIGTTAGFRVQLTNEYSFDFSGGALGVNGNISAAAVGSRGGEIFADRNVRLGRNSPTSTHGVTAYIDGSVDRYMISRDGSQGRVNVGNGEDDTYLLGKKIQVGKYGTDLADGYWRTMTDASGNTYTVLTKA